MMYKLLYNSKYVKQGFLLTAIFILSLSDSIIVMEKASKMNKDVICEAVKKISIPGSLKTISFNRLGIVKIDVWGNPTKLLYSADFGDEAENMGS